MSSSLEAATGFRKDVRDVDVISAGGVDKLTPESISISRCRSMKLAGERPCAPQGRPCSTLKSLGLLQYQQADVGGLAGIRRSSNEPLGAGELLLLIPYLRSDQDVGAEPDHQRE